VLKRRNNVSAVKRGGGVVSMKILFKKEMKLLKI
jgi:hypothetical protein